MKMKEKSPVERVWRGVVSCVLFWYLLEVYGPLDIPSFWGHMLRTVAELMMLLYTYVGQQAMIQVTRTQPHPSNSRAMAKRSAEEMLDRDCSPRGRSGGPSERGQSMPAGPSATAKRSQPVPSPNFKLEGQIAELAKGLQMMGTQLQTLANVVERQQSAFLRTQETFQVQQTMIQNLQAQRTALPISPRVPNPRSSPFGAATTGGQANGLSPFGIMGQTTTNQADPQPNATASGEGSSGVSAGIPKIVLPGGIEIPLGASSSTTAPGTGGTSEKPVLDAFQRSAKWLPEMPAVDAIRIGVHVLKRLLASRRSWRTFQLGLALSLPHLQQKCVSP